MKRLLSVFLLVFSLLAQTSAWAFSPKQLENTIKRKTAAPQKQRQTKKTTTPHKQATAAAQPETPILKSDANTWYGLPIISWQEFKQANEKSIEEEETAVPTEDWKKITTVKQGMPDYAKITKNVKYIYIGEVHVDSAVEPQIKNIIRAVRKANPNKRILLATEFLETHHPLINPLHRANKATNLLGDATYNINDLASELKIDTLALDDYIIQQTDQGALIKVGDRYVRINGDAAEQEDIASVLSIYGEDIAEMTDERLSMIKDDPAMWHTVHLLLPQDFAEIYQLIQQDQSAKQDFQRYWNELDPGNEIFMAGYSAASEHTKEIFEYYTNNKYIVADYLSFQRIHWQIFASSWGVTQRNKDWASRIKKVANEYDVVIVWAGDGHIDPTAPSSLFQQGLASANSVSISVWPLEYHTTQETTEDIQKADELQSQLCLANDKDPSEEEISSFDTFCNQSGVDINKPFYVSQNFTEPPAAKLIEQAGIKTPLPKKAYLVYVE